MTNAPFAKAPQINNIKVTAALIETGVQRDEGFCMGAEAIKERWPDAHHVLVDITDVRLTDIKSGERYRWFTPTVLMQAIIDFDQGKRPDPFSFSLRDGVRMAHKPSRPKAAREEKKTSKALVARAGDAAVRTGDADRPLSAGDADRYRAGRASLMRSRRSKGRIFGLRKYKP